MQTYPAFCSDQHTQLVFAECGLGAVVLTINVIVLGGELVFFQVRMATWLHAWHL